MRIAHASLFLFFLAVFSAQAAALPQSCEGDGTNPAADNQRVLEWKRSTPNKFLGRAHVQGTVERVYEDRNGHDHVSVRIGPKPEDTIEVIYNLSFGQTPEIRVGMAIEACGDYITSNRRSGRYPPSPDGAILHWIHRSNTRFHPHGFFIIDGKIYGDDVVAGARNYRGRIATRSPNYNSAEDGEEEEGEE